MDSSHCRPTSRDGQRVLAHELAHVVQQHGHDGGWAKSNDERPESNAREPEAEEVASTSPDGERAQTARPSRRSLTRLTPEQFRAGLGATPDQKTTIDTLFSDAQFKGLWDYLATCKAVPKKDLGPLALKVTPGLKIGGVEQFGGYSPATRTLEINPTKAEHTANPQELVDTIIHELIHAEDDLEKSCVQAGAPASPLAGAGTDRSAPALADVKGTPEEDRLLRELGPGASNPCEEFIDINKKAQQIIVTLLKSDIQTTHIGRPTLTFVNDTLRNNPTALAEYKACRDIACSKLDADSRKAEIGKCSQQIITKYVTPPSTPVPVPAPAPGVFPPSPPPPKKAPSASKRL